MLKKIFIASVLISVSCDESADKPKVDCNGLVQGLLESKSVIVKPVINNLAADLQPNPIPSDPTGQKANLMTLVERFNSTCSNLKAKVTCYACAKSLPPQSIVEVTVDSAGYKVSRTISVMTPDHGVLTFASVR